MTTCTNCRERQARDVRLDPDLPTLTLCQLCLLALLMDEEAFDLLGARRPARRPRRVRADL